MVTTSRRIAVAQSYEDLALPELGALWLSQTTICHSVQPDCDHTPVACKGTLVPDLAQEVGGMGQGGAWQRMGWGGGWIEPGRGQYHLIILSTFSEPLRLVSAKSLM